MKQLFSYFLNGLLLIFPVAATYLVLSYAIKVVDGIFEFSVPGMGFLVVLVLTTILGFLGRNVVAKPFVDLIIQFIEKTPVINVIYKSTREFAEAFIGNDRKLDKPVLYDAYNNNTFRVGFLTQESLVHLGLPEYVGIYVPHSYNFSGNFYMVERSRIRPLKLSTSEAMRFAVTGGIINVEGTPKMEG